MFLQKKVVDKDKFLETINNDSTLLDTIIELFKEQSADSLNGMKQALEGDDLDAFQRAAHDLKNIGRNIAADSLVDHSHTLEQHASEKQVELALKQMEKTEKLLKKALKELEGIRAKTKG